MKHKEHNKKNVEMMSVEEELKNLSPNTWDTCYPHG